MVQLQNVFGQPIHVRMAFFNQSGEPLALKLDGQETSQIEFELPLRGHRRFQTSGDGPLKLGYARIESTGFPVMKPFFKLRRSKEPNSKKRRSWPARES